MPVSTKIQLRRDNASVWTSTNPTLAAGEIGFETDTLKFKVGNGSNAWTTLKYSQDASLLSGAATLTTLTTTGAVTIGGNLTVNGTTTSINSSTLQVDDKNLELGSVAAVAGISATVESGTSTVETATSYNFIVGQSVTRTAGVAYAGGTIASIVSPTEFTVTGTFGATGSITLDIGGATDNTADGAGLTVKGATDKTFNYTNATLSWTSNQDLNLVTGKVYEINGTTVLSSTQVLGFTPNTANSASTIVTRDASGNFATNTITASLTGVASLATNLTGGTASKGEIVYMSGVNTTSKLTATTTNNQVLAYNTATNAPFWVTPNLSNTYFGTTTTADQLRGALAASNTTGTGNLVFANTPTFTTPALGAATGTSLNVTGQLISTQATGTAPLLVSSNTVVTNLNADLLDGYNTATAATANTVAVRDTNGSLTANVFIGASANVTGQLISTVTTGTAPFVVSSTTKVTNLNADTVDGYDTATAATANTVAVRDTNGSVTANVFIGASANVTGQLISTVTTGTAPLSVASTTRVTNLNAATAGVADSATIAGRANNITATANNLIFVGATANTLATLAYSTGNNGQVLGITAGQPAFVTPSATGVTNVATGTGLTGGPITTTGTISIDLASALTYTTTQRINVNSDVLTFGIRANTTQTANIFEARDGAAAMMMSLSNVGTLFAVTIDGGSA
jgi:hypothetical protein